MFDVWGSVEPEVRAVDDAHARIGRAQLDLLRAIVRLDNAEVWSEWGARDTAHLVAMRYDVSEWKARRWIAAAHALERLPILSEALATGELGLDKVVELCRFATSSTEARLLRWARGVSCAAVRHRADREVARDIEEVREDHAARSITWDYHDDGRRFGLHLDAPAECGPVVIRAIEREAERIPAMPGEDDPSYVDARRADALVALCSARLAADPQPDRSSVVVHAELKGLEAGTGGCEVENGPVLHPETVRRLLCNAKFQTVVEDERGKVVAVASMRREPSAWMMRQLRWRDRECRFPGCGARRFVEAHHIRWWGRGGHTDLANMVLICSFHHRLTHELGWRIEWGDGGELVWRRPDGTRHRPGPSRTRAAPAAGRVPSGSEILEPLSAGFG
jgi:hypothetical protein